MTVCRFCKKSDRPDRMLHYAVHHHAHPECYLEAGKPLEALHDWVIARRIPYQVLEKHGLLHIAEAALARLRNPEDDAKLIAAAPDLREACELVQRAWTGDGVDMATAVDACLLAIAKAEGRTRPID